MTMAECEICGMKSDTNSMVIFDAPEDSNKPYIFVHPACEGKCTLYWILNGAPDLKDIYAQINEMNYRKALRKPIISKVQR